MSRRANSCRAATARTTTAATEISAGHHRSPENACIAWPQPIGDSHESAPFPTSPTARRTYDAAITAPVMPYIARVLSVSCAATRATAPKTRPASAAASPRFTDPGDGETVADQAGRDESAEQDVRDNDDQCGGDERRVAPDRPGADELVPAALLLGAGVPADEEHAHQPGEDRAERRGLPGDLSAERVERPRGSGHGDERGVARHVRGRPVELGLGRVETLRAHGLRPVEEDPAEDPPQQHQPVAAQVEPQQRSGAVEVHDGRLVAEPRRRSGAGTAPPASAAGWSGCGCRTVPAPRARRRAARVDLEDRPVALDHEVVHADELGPAPWAAAELGGDRRTGQVPQLGQRARSRRCGRRG